MNAQLQSLEKRCLELAEELGLAHSGTAIDVQPLTGGVASDIARVDLSGRRLAMKFALSKLKVKEDWFAPVQRNSAEYAWLSVASAVLGERAIKLYGRSERLHGFAMEFVGGPEVYLWKSALLEQREVQGEAAAVGDLVGRMHSASCQPGFDRRPFANRDDFFALRIEPYLLFTARRHLDLATSLQALGSMLFHSTSVLVHGDVSPKNILCREGYPVILDAECATMGDGCFDAAICPNQLLLKACHLPQLRETLLANVMDFWSSYSAHVCWEEPEDVEARTVRLLPALMLARVDGKSPVEYLTPREQSVVRQIARTLILSPVPRLPDLVSTCRDLLREADE